MVEIPDRAHLGFLVELSRPAGQDDTDLFDGRYVDLYDKPLGDVILEARRPARRLLLVISDEVAAVHVEAALENDHRAMSRARRAVLRYPVGTAGAGRRPERRRRVGIQGLNRLRVRFGRRGEARPARVVTVLLCAAPTHGEGPCLRPTAIRPHVNQEVHHCHGGTKRPFALSTDCSLKGVAIVADRLRSWARTRGPDRRAPRVWPSPGRSAAMSICQSLGEVTPYP